jgi:hypothetical protein
MLLMAKLSMAISFYFTGRSLYHTLGHGFSNDFYGEPIGLHMQFHAVREFFMALGIVAIVALLMYGHRNLRTPIAWWIMLIGSAFLTLGVWISMPIVGTGLPGFEAALNHVGNTVFAAIALGLCWKSYQPSSE